MLAVACSKQPEPDNGVETGDDNALVDAVFAAWDLPGSPGCALAVAQHGKLVYSRGYGYANLDHNTPVTPQTVFDVASINKQFMAASLSMLALEGKLSFDDNVRKWLPELPEFERPITLRHMIYHTSGLRDYLGLFPLAGRSHYFPLSHAQILDMMSRQLAPIFPAGEQYKYSNTAYMLLAQVLERASGQSTGDFTQQRIFEPLGMSGSLMYDNYEEIIPHRFTGYDRHEDGEIRMVHNYNFDVPGDGQLYATVEDLLRWDNYLHGIEKPAIHSMMLTEGHLNNGEPLGYAQGIRLSEYRGLRTLGHTGGSCGSNSVLMRFVEPGLSIAIACNDGFSSPYTLALQVADYYLADLLAPQSSDEESGSDQKRADTATEAPSLTSSQLAELTGSFFSPELDAIYRFSMDDGGLVVRIEQEPPFKVIPVADDLFKISFDQQAYSGQQTASLEITRNSSGAIIGFGLSSGTERGIIFEKQVTLFSGKSR